MTRIGFAYNQKPEGERLGGDDVELPRSEEKPPSTRREKSRNTTSATATADASLVAPSAVLGDADRYAEWDSVETIDAVADALAAYGDVIRLEATPDFPEALRDASPDIVFNIAEGLEGMNREAHVPAICEFFGVPYSGSDPFTLSLCLNKARTKEVLAYNGIATAPFALASTSAEIEAIAAGGASSISMRGDSFPLFLKPVHEGSSKGITEKNFVRNAAEFRASALDLLTTYQQPVLIERFLSGAEFTCGVLGNGAGATVLPIVAINFGSLPPGALPIYGYEAKWVWDRPENPLEIFQCPARVPAALTSAIEDVVLRAYRVLGCRDWSRVDVRLDEAGVPNIVEVNPLPGILPNPEDNSCLPKAARAAGIDYDGLIQRCLLHAAERHGVRMTRRVPAFEGAA